MELGMQREEGLATRSSSGPPRRQPFSAGNVAARARRRGGGGGQKHSMCFRSAVMSSFDREKGEKKKVLMTEHYAVVFPDPVAVSNTDASAPGFSE